MLKEVEDYIDELESVGNGLLNKEVKREPKDYEEMVDTISNLLKEGEDSIASRYSGKVGVIETQDVAGIDAEIEKNEKLIETLKFEGEEINAKMIENAQKRIEDAKKQRESIINEHKSDTRIYQGLDAEGNRKYGREVSQDEKDKMDTFTLKDLAARALKRQQMRIEEDITSLQAEIDKNRQDLINYESERKTTFASKIEYVKDAEGNPTTEMTPESKEAVKKMNAKATRLDNKRKKLQGNMEELTGLKEKTQSLINEIEGRNEVINPKKPEPEIVTPETPVTPVAPETPEVPETPGNPEPAGPVPERPETPDSHTIEENNGDTIDIKSAKRKDGMLTYSYQTDPGKRLRVDVNNYKKYLKEIKDNGYNYGEEQVTFSKKILKKVDPLLLDFLEKYNPDLGLKVAKTLASGKDLSEFKDLFKYDMSDLSEMTFSERRICKKIARMADRNGLEVKGIENCRSIFDRLFRRNKNALKSAETEEIKSLPKPEEKAKTDSEENTSEMFKKYYELSSEAKKEIEQLIEEKRKAAGEKTTRTETPSHEDEGPNL